jgi:hypothetical protein
METPSLIYFYCVIPVPHFLSMQIYVFNDVNILIISKISKILIIKAIRSTLDKEYLTAI